MKAVTLSVAVAMIIAGYAHAETRIEIRPTTVPGHNYTVTNERGLFGERRQYARAPNGQDYVVPGSPMEQAMARAKTGGFSRPKLCDDGLPQAYYHNGPMFDWGLRLTCATGRAQ